MASYKPAGTLGLLTSSTTMLRRRPFPPDSSRLEVDPAVLRLGMGALPTPPTASAAKRPAPGLRLPIARSDDRCLGWEGVFAEAGAAGEARRCTGR